MPTRKQNAKYGPYTNVTINQHQAKALRAFQTRLTTELGFEPTLGDTVKWLTKNSTLSLVKDVAVYGPLEKAKGTLRTILNNPGRIDPALVQDLIQSAVDDLDSISKAIGRAVA